MLLQYPSVCINMKLYVSAISSNNSSRIKARKVFSPFLLFILFFSVLFLNFYTSILNFFFSSNKNKKGENWQVTTRGEKKCTWFKQWKPTQLQGAVRFLVYEGDGFVIIIYTQTILDWVFISIEMKWNKIIGKNLRN